MKIPKILKCGGLDYEVIESDDISQFGDCIGATLHYSQKIFIKPNQKDDGKEKTFLHEIIHIALYQSGMTLRLERYDKDLVEDIVCSLENTLYQILKDNKII